MFWSDVSEYAEMAALEAEAAENAAYEAWCRQEMQAEYERDMAAAWFQHRSREWYERKPDGR
jgi:hypothetical protein